MQVRVVFPEESFHSPKLAFMVIESIKRCSLLAFCSVCILVIVSDFQTIYKPITVQDTEKQLDLYVKSANTQNNGADYRGSNGGIKIHVPHKGTDAAAN